MAMELVCRRYISGKLVRPGDTYDVNGDVIQSLEVVKRRHDASPFLKPRARKASKACQYGTDQLEPGQTLFIEIADRETRRKEAKRLEQRFRYRKERDGLRYKIRSFCDGLLVERIA